MTVTLPEPFLARMRQMLGGGYEAFVASYDQPRAYGLRLNTWKTDSNPAAAERLHGLFGLEPVPWCKTGYYYDEETKPGRHPYHAAGVYYIQEPSAMSAAELLSPQPGERVLDLAAAPGGKATQIADRMQGQGLLVANEIHPARAEILSENIERMGIRHAIVTSASPGELAERFPRYFDRIMVDAPCSGEGMFRKEPETVLEWSEQAVETCAVRQLAIMQEAVKMLKPGGTIAYSTCTFSVEENERVIGQITHLHPELSVERMERLWPHTHRGEGHFVAVLKHRGTYDTDESGDRPPFPSRPAKRGKQPSSGAAPRKAIESAMREFEAFAADMLRPTFRLTGGEAVLFGDQLYWMPTADGAMHPDMLRGIKTLRPGLHLGTIRKQRFVPSHALALALTESDVTRVHRMEADSPQTEAYLRGEALPSDGKGWTLVTVDGWPVGWGKASDGLLKNHYPKGLRRPN